MYIPDRAGQNGPFSVFIRYNGLNFGWLRAKRSLHCTTGFAPTGSVLLFAENGPSVFAHRVCAAMAWHFRFCLCHLASVRGLTKLGSQTQSQKCSRSSPSVSFSVCSFDLLVKDLSSLLLGSAHFSGRTSRLGMSKGISSSSNRHQLVPRPVQTSPKKSRRSKGWLMTS